MAELRQKTLGFACQQCRASKRRVSLFTIPQIPPRLLHCWNYSMEQYKQGLSSSSVMVLNHDARIARRRTRIVFILKNPRHASQSHTGLLRWLIRSLISCRRKYWDESYVKSLENQIQALLELRHQETNNSNANNDLPFFGPGYMDPTNRPSSEYASNERQSQDVTESSQSLQAMEELSVMMWRTNLADGVTVNSDPGSKPTEITAIRPDRRPRLNTPRHISYYAHDPDRVYRIANLFLEFINREHQFTQYKTSEVFLTFPNHPPDLLFLHAAMLAAGATFENEADSLSLSDKFAELCESLVFTCFKHAPSIYIIQGLSILSWRSLALGHDHLGWTFLSMAAGMAVHLRLHVLALDEIASDLVKPSLDTVRAFWSFYMTDRTSISILGRNCILPWRRVNVPAFETFFPDGKGDMAQVSFAWQCKLWYMQDRNMDQMYVPLNFARVHRAGRLIRSRFSSSFEKQSTTDQVSVLISTHRNLGHFIKSLDKRLEITRGIQPKPVLLFHMAYQMAILITMPPFLRLFAALKAEQNQLSQALSLVLRSITSAAGSMVRLVRGYCNSYGYKRANPLLIHHILSASIVHLMNATATSASFRGHSTRMVRQSVSILEGLNPYWPLRCQKSIETIRALANRWNVGFALVQPDDKDQEQNFSGNERHGGQSNQHNIHVMSHANPWLDPLTSDAAYEEREDAFDIRSRVDRNGGDIEADEEQDFNISMVNIPTAEEDGIFGLSNFFHNFESYPDLF